MPFEPQVSSLTRYLSFPLRRGVIDPPESWETWMPDHVVRGLGRGPTGPHPYRPLREADVPAGALEALAAAAGVTGLDQLLVVPPTGRPISSGRRWGWVSAPALVLGLGTGAVALWVESSGVTLQVGLDQVAVIEDVRILLYSRLSFRSRDRALRVRYSTVARYDVLPALSAFRRAAAGDPLPIGEPIRPTLPLKWANVADGATVRLGECEAALLYDEPPTGRRRRRPTLLALTPYELVVARQPSWGGPTDVYGVDSVHVARRRIESIAIVGSQLAVRARGVHLVIDVGERLAAEARQSFAGLLPWV
jgi:hypothetical protein